MAKGKAGVIVLEAVPTLVALARRNPSAVQGAVLAQIEALVNRGVKVTVPVIEALEDAERARVGLDSVAVSAAAPVRVGPVPGLRPPVPAVQRAAPVERAGRGPCVVCAQDGRDTPSVVVGYAGAPLCAEHLTPRERVDLLPGVPGAGESVLDGEAAAWAARAADFKVAAEALARQERDNGKTGQEGRA